MHTGDKIESATITQTVDIVVIISLDSDNNQLLDSIRCNALIDKELNSAIIIMIISMSIKE